MSGREFIRRPTTYTEEMLARLVALQDEQVRLLGQLLSRLSGPVESQAAATTATAAGDAGRTEVAVQAAAEEGAQEVTGRDRPRTAAAKRAGHR
ncbi:MAG: hypothetical protein DIU70_003645 [Bacillota bacterium]|nr:MAG: hypothetical protein DIU70_00765 [Bacillota bacterium]